MIRELAEDEVAELPEKEEISVVVSAKRTTTPANALSGKTLTPANMSFTI